MKIIRYYSTQSGVLYPIELDSELVQHIRWNRAETLKIEIWPFDLKIGPSTQIPYGKRKSDEDRVGEVIKLTDVFRAKRREEKERPNQETLIRFNETRTPYSEEFTKRDDARNRAYLSKKVSKRRKGCEEPPAQIDAPF
jgi:hypothetical protein